MKKFDATALEPTNNINHSSKGNQLKWPHDGGWYKADHMGYESLSEIVVSSMLAHCDLAFPFVRYEPAEIVYANKIMRGCFSDSFLPPGMEIITVDRLVRQAEGKSLAYLLACFSSPERKIAWTANKISEIVGGDWFGKYLTALLEIDAVFLNEDRHTNNIAVLYRSTDNTFHPCPLFDFGLSLFSDLRISFPADKPMDECYAEIRAKPFSEDFFEQLDAAESTFGIQVHFSFSNKEIEGSLAMLDGLYPKEYLERVHAVLLEQRRRYSYLFRNK